jgi:hypothetical protein
MHRTVSLALALCVVSVGSLARQEQSLTRDEVSVIKKKLVAAAEALGQLPDGYAKKQERFDLPTEAYPKENAGTYYLVGAGVSFQCGSSAEQKSEKDQKALEKEYQKKLAEAQAKGDYEAMAKLGQEMQQKAAKMQLGVVEGARDPIDVSIRFNAGSGATIDPDAVVMEGTGFIALKSDVNDTGDKGRIVIYFDPINLKDTKQLSRVDMKTPEGGIKKRTGILNVTVELSGPLAEIQKWAQRIDTKKVLAQIDAPN